MHTGMASILALVAALAPNSNVPATLWLKQEP